MEEQITEFQEGAPVEPEAPVAALVTLEDFANDHLHWGIELVGSWGQEEHLAGRYMDTEERYAKRLEAFAHRPV